MHYLYITQSRRVLLRTEFESIVWKGRVSIKLSLTIEAKKLC